MSRILGPVPSDRWESKVRAELSKQLPANWIVVCNVSYLWTNEEGYTRDGQADFVVLAPGLGMAIVEVKGTRKIWVGEDGTWYKITHKGLKLKLKEPPPEQAGRNMHNLTTKVKEKLGEVHFPGLFAWLVVYPNGEVNGKLDTYFENSFVGKKNLHQLKSSIEGVLIDRGKHGLGKQFTEDLATESSKILTNGYFVVKSVDTDLDAEEDTQDIDQLTRQQFAALRGAFELPSVSIVGPAGSGKTVLAIWKLLALLEEGRHAVYVCFNTPLAKHLKLRYPDAAVSIVSVDKFFLDLTGTRPQSHSDFFTHTLPDLVMGHTFDMGEEDRYDAIIVDEAQDFGSDRLTALQCLLAEQDREAQWLIFSDHKQNLYQGGKDSPLDAEVTYRLYHNCRNTKRLNSATNSVCHVEVQSMLGVPEGEHPQVAMCKSELMAQKAWDLVRQVSPTGGAVILSPFILAKSCMKDSRKGHGLELTTDINRLGQSGYVFFSTIKSFKGLEAGHVVLVHAGIPDAHQALAAEDLYVAFTRATTRLDIVTTNQEAKAWYQAALPHIV